MWVLAKTGTPRTRKRSIRGLAKCSVSIQTARFRMTIHSSAQQRGTIKQFGRWAYAIPSHLRFNPAQDAYLSMMLDKTHGKRLTMASSVQITVGIFARAFAI